MRVRGPHVILGLMNISHESPSTTDQAEGSPQGWRLSDGLRVLGVLGIPLAWPIAGPAAAAAISLVWGGQMVARSLLPRGPADWGMQMLFLASGWFAVLGLYQQFLWLDIPMHYFTTGAVAWLTWTVLVRSGGLSHQPRTRVQRVTQVAIVTALGALGSVLWELGEWFGYSFTTSQVGVGYDDTIGDMFCGVLGALTVAVLVTFGRRVRP